MVRPAGSFSVQSICCVWTNAGEAGIPENTFCTSSGISKARIPGITTQKQIRACGVVRHGDGVSGKDCEGGTIKWAGDREDPALIYFPRESTGWIGLPRSQRAEGDVIRRTKSLWGGQGAPPRSRPPPEPPAPHAHPRDRGRAAGGFVGDRDHRQSQFSHL